MFKNWKNKKIAIFGLGVEGLAMVEYLVKQEILPVVLDKKTENEIDQKTLRRLKDLKLKMIFGDHYLDDLTSYNVIIRSPGISVLHPAIEKAKNKGAVITSQTKIFFDLCPCPIIGVTGTKGKGTTSTLIFEMLKKDGKDVFLGGNIGVPPITFVDKLNPRSLVVLELSSFQLEDLTKSPHIAVMLMITPEHLGRDTVGTQNYHESMEVYIDAKRNILRFQTPQDFAIINRDYPASNESSIHTDGKLYFVSRETEIDEGCFIKDNTVVLRRGGVDEKIIDCNDILLPGKHNWENVCVAVMAVKLVGANNHSPVHTNSIVSVLKTFKGLEHRLELVAEINRVKYYDDSFSTTPETAIAAIKAFENPEILILGGSSKGSDFSELGKVISAKKNIKAIVGVGEEWKRIKSELRITNHELRIIEGCKNMTEIVQAAEAIAKPVDVVLLSPACASFDMFKNYKDRGEQFKSEIKKL